MLKDSGCKNDTPYDVIEKRISSSSSFHDMSVWRRDTLSGYLLALIIYRKEIMFQVIL